jgi:drug/metabolite transporter (DMT)-like permease
VPVALALLSSLLWGTSDFLGGTATRRLPAPVVVGASQAVALVLLVGPAALLGARPDDLASGVAAGLIGVLALGAFYAALAGGTMGVVAPVAALGALLPVAVGLLRGEVPSGLQVAGIAVAIVGVVLASGPELSGGASPRPLLLACAAAVGFGMVAVLLADGSKGPQGAVLVTLLVMRSTSVAALGVALLVVRTRDYETAVRWPDLPLLAAIGIGDVGANAAYAVASRGALLSVVSVLASLYPVVTVLLARQLHGERLRTVQVVGALGTLGGVALLAAG